MESSEAACLDWPQKCFGPQAEENKLLDQMKGTSFQWHTDITLILQIIGLPGNLS